MHFLELTLELLCFIVNKWGKDEYAHHLRFHSVYVEMQKLQSD